MGVFDRLFRHAPWRYLVSAALGLALALLVLLRDGFALRLAWYNALTVAGAVLILLGLLGLVAYHGAFDIFGYSFSSMVRRRYENLYAYSEAKREKRGRRGWTFVPMITIGLVFLAAGALVRIL